MRYHIFGMSYIANTLKTTHNQTQRGVHSNVIHILTYNDVWLSEVYLLS